MTKTVELYCNAGNHTWNRPSQRGKRPLNCPEHSVVAPKRERIEVRQPTVPTELEPFLVEGFTPTEDWHRPLKYIAEQVASGAREQADVTLLLTTAKDITRRHKLS